MSRHSDGLAAYLFEHARDILLVIDAASGRIVDANQAAVDAYQYDHAALCTRTIFDLRAADLDPVAGQMQRARAQGVLFETIHQRRDATTFPVEVSSRGIAVHDQQLLLSVVRDISTRKRLEQERETLIETTTQALAMRDEFLVMASHELRAPVTNVSLQLQQLQRCLERNGTAEHAAAAVTASLAEVRRLTGLIDTLLDAQRARTGIVLERSELDLAELLRDVTSRLHSRATLAGSELVLDVGTSIRGHWDRLRLDQVLTNLVMNAIKYGCGRPIHLHARLLEETHAQVEVRDAGIGISDEDRVRVFEKYERAVSPAYGGLGLGLYITRQLVEAHGGTIEVRGSPGKGSTFRVTVPRRGP